MRRRTSWWRAAAVVVCWTWADAAFAAAEGPGLDPALERCTGDTGARLRFVEARLEGDRRYADWWWKGWSSVFAGGVVVQGARAGFEGDEGQRADLIVSAAKASIGLARSLWSPPPARLGAGELRTLSTATPQGCAERLARAEEILRRNAGKTASERRSWIPHAANLGLNLAGALIVAEGFDEQDGWISGAIGLAVGEGRIWSYPWQAENALAEYERRFPASGVPHAPAPSWHFESWGAGARVTLRY